MVRLHHHYVAWRWFDRGWTVDDIVERFNYCRATLEEDWRDYVERGYHKAEHEVSCAADLNLTAIDCTGS
tara:strand:+ start:3068 stop:3277 length:210 start_codon:yes stop_codon:yes gene_type:complete